MKIGIRYERKEEYSIFVSTRIKLTKNCLSDKFLRLLSLQNFKKVPSKNILLGKLVYFIKLFHFQKLTTSLDLLYIFPTKSLYKSIFLQNTPPGFKRKSRYRSNLATKKHLYKSLNFYFFCFHAYQRWFMNFFVNIFVLHLIHSESADNLTHEKS